MNAEISETIRAAILGFAMQIPETSAQGKFICYAHKPLKMVASTVLMLEYNF